MASVSFKDTAIKVSATSSTVPASPKRYDKVSASLDASIIGWLRIATRSDLAIHESVL